MPLSSFSPLLYGSALLLLLAMPAQGQLTFDSNTDADQVQNGGGTWDLTKANWWSGGGNTTWNNNGTTIAAFGTNTTAAGGTIDVVGTIQLGGMQFNPLQLIPVGIAHTFNGGTLAFANDAVIKLGDNSSSGSGGALFVNLNSTHTGNNLTVQRDAAGLTGTQTFQYLRFGSANPNLTGVLTVDALSATRGVFLLTVSGASVGGFSEIVIKNGSVLATGGAGSVYANAITLAGTGSNSGAIRVDASNVEFSGAMQLSGDAAVNTNGSVTGAIISGAISESGGSYGFQRLSVNQNSTLLLRGASSYTGATTLGRSGGVAGNTILDFTATTAPTNDVLYHETTAGALNVWGGPVGGTALTLQGKAGEANSQRFGVVTANGTRSNIVLTPGSGGSMALGIASMTRSGSASLGFAAPLGATITTTGMANGLVGPWATITDNAGTGAWAAVTDGVVTTFSGNLPHVTGTAVNALVGYTTASHLQISSSSDGVVLTGGASVTLGSITMADADSSRILDIGSGNTLRMPTVGGIQIMGGSKDLEVGVRGSAGTVTGSTSTSQLWLTNMSNDGTLTIHSEIANNGAGVLSVYVNGTGNTVLTGSNSFTGAVQIGSGSLEIQSSGALGTAAGGVAVLYGGALRLAGNATVEDPISVTGFGVNNDGALRNISGDNTIKGLVTLTNPTRIHSDGGNLALSADATSNIITGTFALSFGGSGTVTVNGRIATGTGTVTKDGTGSLILNGDNTFTGAMTISAGTVRVGHANALGGAGATTVTTGGMLEIANGLTLGAEPITLSSTGLNNAGGIRIASGSGTVTGLTTVNGTSRIQADEGSLLIFDAGSGNSILKDTSATARALTFGGSGDILMLDPIAKSATVTAGLFSITKDGSGTLTLQAANTYTGTTAVNNGVLHLNFAGATSPASNILYSGATTPGTVSFGGGTLKITGKSGGSHTQDLGPVTVTAGRSQLTVVQNGASNIMVNTGAWTRPNQGSTLLIQLPAFGKLTTTGGTDNALITHDNIAYALVSDSDWAATSALAGGVRNVVGLSSITNGYTAATATSLAGNADMASGVPAVAVGASTNISSLRFNAAQDSTVTVGTGNILTTGGILVTPGVGEHVSTITGGTLRSASTTVSNTNADLVIIQNNTLGELVIGSVIANNATASSVTGLTKAGPGTLVLQTATHTYTGTTRVQDGVLHLKSGSINAGTEFTLGSGTTSGKIVLGAGTTGVTLTGDWLRIDGTGTTNAVVGGATAMSTLALDNDAASDFRKGFLGGAGANENNLNLTITSPATVVQLGAANTYAGKTAILRGILEVEKLADAGTASSIGTGNATPILEMGSQTTGSVGSFATAVLRYSGSSDSTTNRVINVTNSDVAAEITSVTAVIENIGSGTLKFTSPFTAGGSNPVGRTLRLEGTNAGANEIVGIGNASASILTSLVKNGSGTWILTGSSTYSGGTTVNGGMLLVNNELSAGSATGTGLISVASGATFGGQGQVTLSADERVTIAGGAELAVGNSLAPGGPSASALTISTAGSGALVLEAGALLTLDLFSRGSGDSIVGTSDLLTVNGLMSLSSNVRLAVGNPLGIQDFAAGDEWQLFDWSGLTGPIDGTFSSFELPTVDAGLHWDMSRLYSDGVLSLMVVPEPTRMALLMTAALLVALRRRRAKAME